MVRSGRLRRLLCTVAIVVGVLLAGLGFETQAVATPLRQGGVDFEWRLPVNPPPIVVPPSSQASAVISGLTLRNSSSVTTTYTIAVTSAPRGWRTELSTDRVTLTPANTAGSLLFGISLNVIIPAGAQLGNYSLTVTAFRLGANGQPDAQSDLFIPLTLVGGSPVPTPEPAPGCPEVNDPGNSYDSASLVRVDLEQSHGICTTGDEDWFRFAAVGGKVYTIDITQMDAGLDLSLELYDEQRNRIADNDDFFNRDPAAPNPTDKRPRIQSWRSPRDGVYVVRVRDTLGVGGRNLGYRFVVRGESFGPTPTTLVEVCNDAFEPDGLPEIARLIVSNETQPRRALCPEGDADWARFFGLAGRLYVIYTDTRPYAADPSDPLTFPAPGADTILLLADRDGQRILDINNDIPGGNSLDSEIQFRPVVDGFYYIQVKNVGDIGNQFIRYDLTVRACPGQYCRPNRPGLAPAAGSGGGAGAPGAPTPTFGLTTP